MRKSASWMTIWDDRILEIMREDGPTSPTPLSKHDYIRIGKSGVSKRLNRMREHGLIQELGNGVYSITTTGESYLDGEIDAEKLSEGNDYKNDERSVET